MISRRQDNMLAVAWAINSLAYSIVYPFLPIYLHSSRGLPMDQVGLIFPAMGLGVMIGPPLSGFLADRFGRRKLLYGSTLGRGLVFMVLALLALIDGPLWSFAILLSFSSMLGTFFQIASDAYLTDITAPAERPHTYSKIRVGTNLGWMLGPAIGAFLSTTPFSLLFSLTGVLCAASAVFVYHTCPETHQRRQQEPSRRPDAPEFSMMKMLTHREFMITIILNFLLMMLVSQLFSTLSVYATERVGISKNWLGLVYSVNGLTIVLTQVWLTRLLDRKGVDMNLRMCFGSTMYVLGYFGMAFIGNHGQMMLLVAVLTLGEVIVQPSLYATVSRLAPADGRGRYMGALGLIRGLGFSLGPYFGALLYQHWPTSPVLLWGTLSSSGVLAAVGFYIFWKRHRHQEGISP